MAMQAVGPKGLNAEMNVTPMIDVLLVLIIIFLMITPSERGLETQIPQKSTDGSPPQPESTIVIQVQQSQPGTPPTLKINKQPVQWNELAATLQKIFSARAEKVAFVEGDPGVDFQDVATVIDVAHYAGVEHIGLMTPQSVSP